MTLDSARTESASSKEGEGLGRENFADGFISQTAGVTYKEYRSVK